MAVHIENAGMYDDGIIKFSDNCFVKHEVLGFKPDFDIKTTPVAAIINEFRKTPLSMLQGCCKK